MERVTMLVLVYILVFAGCSTQQTTNATHQDYQISEHLSNQEIRTYELTVTQETINYTQNAQTPVLALNGQVPGPLLTGVVGEVVEITVHNKIEEPVSIHWHGFQLPNNQDGVAGITEKGIAPAESFTYRFELTIPGTYWYHSHVDTTRHIEMGLQAPFVVHEQQPAYDYQNEEVLIVDDILIDEETGEWVPFTVGRMHGRFGSRYLINGAQKPTIETGTGMTRLRIINSANARSFTLSFGAKQFEVIGKDIGLLQEPYNATSITIHPGERYDLLIDLPESRMPIYYETSRGITVMGTLDADASRTGTQRIGSGQKQELPDFSYLLEQEPDEVVELRGVMQPMHGLTWTLDGQAHPEDTYSLELEEGETYKVRMVNTQGQPHPMHLHGQKFQVLARNGQPLDVNGWEDTVMVGGGETVDIGFVAEGAGDWAFHCHILEHADAGMFGVVRIV